MIFFKKKDFEKVEEDKNNNRSQRENIFKTSVELDKKVRKYVIVLTLLLVAVIMFVNVYFNLMAFDFNTKFFSMTIMVLLILLFSSMMLGNSKNPKTNSFFKVLSTIIMGIIGIYGISILVSQPVFRTESYATLVTIKNQEFTEVFPASIKEEELIVVDEEYAHKLGDKVLGEAKLGTKFEVKDYTDIIYQGTPYMVGPLEYRGFFKWNKYNDEGSPGYVLVNKCTAEAKLVNDKKLKYVDSAYLNEDGNRKLFFGTNLNLFMKKNELRFEIDEEGTPYIITSLYNNEIGVLGYKPVKTVVVNAETGKSQVYNIEDTPDWLENVFEPAFIQESLNWNLKYRNGFINAYIGQDGVSMLTKGSGDSITTQSYRHINIGNELYLYSGVTSVGSDESIIGFILTNVTTGENIQIDSGGVTEVAAMDSAQGEVQDLGYYSTFPVLINVNGKPVYFITLKDSTGLVKQYALVDVSNMNNIELGKTKDEAYTNYLNTYGVTKISTEEIDVAVELSTSILRIDPILGEKSYSVILDINGEKKTFKVDSETKEIVNSRDNDPIKVKIVDNLIVEFDNLNY